MTLKIGSYEIATQELYDALKELKVTDDADLKLLDKNGDSKLSEDELAELESDSSEDDDDKKSSEEKSKWADKFSGTTLASILALQDTVDSLEEELNSARARICKASDAAELSDIISSMQDTMSNITNTKMQIYNLMVQAENNVSSSSGTGSSSGSSTSGSSVESSPGTASAIADYALKFVGKQQDEMSSIISNDDSDNYAFNYGQWCCDFVTYCTKEVYGSDCFSSSCCSGSGGYGEWARSNNILMDDRDGLTIDLNKVKPGDYILYNDGNSGGSWYHIGIVTAVHPESGTVDTVEGNTGNSECATHEGVNVKTGGRGYGVSFVLAHNIYGSKS